MSHYVGEIRPFARDLPPRWLPCDGRHLKINSHAPLYSLIRTRYGGDGHTTFALPDLRGRATAGVDERRQQSAGATSGLGGDNASLIPFAVINWGIAEDGLFPSQD
jgi:microcystin-dependent protein